MKKSKLITLLAAPVAIGTIIPCAVSLSSCSCNHGETLQSTIDKINKVLETKTCNTMSQALEAVKSTYDVEAAVLQDQEFVWDQKVNRFAVIDKEGKLVVGPKDYTLNPNKWQLWKMVSESTFDSSNKYSQYLKSSTTNETKTDYSFIAGFDAGKNTNVKYAQYMYETVEDKTAKDIIINTNSKYTNVEVVGWNGGLEDGDQVTHYGEVGDLNILSNDKFIENGKAISCSVSEGTISIAQSANIAITYVKESGVFLEQYKSALDLVYCKTEEIKTEIEQTGEITVEKVQTEAEYSDTKDKKHQEQGVAVEHPFTCSDGTTYDTLSEIATAANAGNTFEGITISFNKDYVMSTAEADAWVPIASANGTSFKGVLDGQGYSIINFNKTSTSTVTLILNNSGKVKNLNFIDCALKSSGSGRASLISFLNSGNVEFSNIKFYNCSTEAATSNGFALSYVVGVGTTALFQNLYTDSKCFTKITAGNQTGFVGQTCSDVAGASGESITFKNCEMHLNVTAYYCAGGYVGQMGAVNDGGFKSYTFENCSSYGDIIISGGTGGNGPMAAGFAGSKQNDAQKETDPSTTIFKNCANYSNVWADDKYVNVDNLGGFVGYSNNPIIPGTTISFEDCVNEGNIGKENTVTQYKPNGCGGFVGRTMSDGNVVWTFTRCENKGIITATSDSSNVCGHFIGILGSPTSPESKQCINCIITSGTLSDPDHRTQITGEPD